jgi:eRF1 domain 3
MLTVIAPQASCPVLPSVLPLMTPPIPPHTPPPMPHRLFPSSTRSQEGSQFCRGFGGIGGILRYQVNMAELEEPSEGGNSDLWSDDF